jgi:hypothetical protein
MNGATGILAFEVIKGFRTSHTRSDVDPVPYDLIRSEPPMRAYHYQLVFNLEVARKSNSMVFINIACGRDAQRLRPMSAN